MTQQRSEIAKWGDEAMFEAQPMLVTEEGARVRPRVFLLSATPDPLGVIASAFRMYAGIPTYDLSEITDEERQQYWEESLVTNLKAAWEFVDLHFFIEGVTRAFTHQMVRQRTAVYAQESLRFAVKRGIAQEAAYPAMLVGDENLTAIWDAAVKQIGEAYNQLIDAGLPAEDARGLLPHCTTTRLNYKTNFRNLIDTLGNRLCTQAQFEWRSVAIGIMQAIRDNSSTYWKPHDTLGIHPDPSGWQWKVLAAARPETFTPVCYKAGHCVFMGQLDRGCTIRDRVNAGQFEQINVEEWAANPWAGITTEDNVRPA